MAEKIFFSEKYGCQRSYFTGRVLRSLPLQACCDGNHPPDKQSITKTEEEIPCVHVHETICNE